MEKTIAILAYTHYLSLKQMEEEYYTFPEDGQPKKGEMSFEEYVFLHKLLYEKLGFEYEESDFISEFKLLKENKFFDFTYHNTIVDNKLARKIEEYYGRDLFVLYFFVVSVLNLSGLSSIASWSLNVVQQELTEEQAGRYKELRTKVSRYSKDLFWFFENVDFFIKYYNLEIVNTLKELRPILYKTRCTPKLLANVHKTVSKLGVDIIFEEKFDFDKVHKAKEMIKELNEIPPGPKGWVKYEKFCIKALNFLFVPPFRRVHYQARNVNGYERRDAILPNHSINGFWFDIKSEFSSKNIVCEFKNIARSHAKESLNQLRIYLSKPTIGKFGLLFVRANNNDKSLRQAQRDAYEQNGILILVVTDNFLEKLLIAKAYFGSCDDLIANEKVRFEINY